MMLTDIQIAIVSGAFAVITALLAAVYRKLCIVAGNMPTTDSRQLETDEIKRHTEQLNRCEDRLEHLQNTFAELKGSLNQSQANSNTLINDLKKEIRDAESTGRLEANKSRHVMVDSILTQIGHNRDEMRTSLERFERYFASQISEMRKTVDDKLQTAIEKKISESFKRVSDRLEQVHKGLGEMQTIASGVGDLKKVLSNVKTRGILGEYQLGNILEQILTTEQYARDVVTRPGSGQYVEYAIKMPGNGLEETVWLPIDSKFPLENYERLVDGFRSGNKQDIEDAQKALIRDIENCAKDISSKYIEPPGTTDFAILFLPVESLYSEVLRHSGLFEKLQREYHVTVTGPTTLSALLNSLQMGFRTLAVQKRSSEVWKVLASVRSEFTKFAEHLEKVQKQLTTASNSLEILRSTRTSQVERKLSNLDRKLLSE